jgi:CcmD family protein
MVYLCLAFSVLWLVTFLYIFALDRQIKDIGRRLDARVDATEPE